MKWLAVAFYALKLRVVFFPNWLLAKVRKPSLLWYLTPGWEERRWVYIIPNDISGKENITEVGLTISLLVPITVVLPAHPFLIVFKLMLLMIIKHNKKI